MTSDRANEALDQARKAAELAYAPYSKFRVGAAVELDDGRFLSGCNIENASYGLCICAERCALWKGQSEYGASFKAKIRSLAVSCVDADASLGPAGRMPCGACRQVMAELMPEGCKIHVDGAGTFTLAQLLPQAFRL